VLRLVAEPSLATHLSEGGRDAAEQCGWESVHDEWRGLFARLGQRDGAATTATDIG